MQKTESPLAMSYYSVIYGGQVNSGSEKNIPLIHLNGCTLLTQCQKGYLQPSQAKAVIANQLQV